MKTAFHGMAAVAVFFAANVVGAGVIWVLGAMFQNAAPQLESPWPWFAICILGAAAAYIFLRGVIACVNGGRGLQWELHT